MINPSPKQLQIRDAKQLDLLVVAPAGCGKTEALALRVQGLIERGIVAAPKKILIVTFSLRARDNIKERLKSYLSHSAMRDRVTVMNFHGLSARIIKAHGSVLSIPSDLTIPESDWVGEQLRKQNVPWDDRRPILEALSTTKRKPLDDAAVEAELQRLGNPGATALEQRRKQEGVLTYDDLPRLAELILSNAAVADLYRSHFAAVVVDEYQDLTPQQLRLVRHIGEKRTTYAGDLAQGIYGFAGAQPDVVDGEIRQECSEVIEFSESHRSSPAVLGVVNSLAGLTGGQALTAADPGSWPGGGVAASIAHADESTEASWIVGFCRSLVNKVPNQRVGIIARTSGRRRFIDNAFANSDIPFFRWDDGVLDTDTAKLVKSLLANFDLAAYTVATDKVAFLREAVGFDSIADSDIRKNLVDALGWVQDLLHQAVLPSDIRARIRVGDSSTLITTPGVHLLSGHVGKGQQFDWVFVAGLEEGFIPFSLATTPSEISEEVRVLSVMMSRARHGVILSRAASVPQNNGVPRPRTPSRFLQQIAAQNPLNGSALIEWCRRADWDAIGQK